jgi:hypothetical protein
LDLLLLLEYKDLLLRCKLYCLPARKYVKRADHESILLPTYWAVNTIRKVCSDQASKSNKPKSNCKTHHVMVYARALSNGLLELDNSSGRKNFVPAFQAAHILHELERQRH